MGRLGDATVAVRRARPVITAVLLFGLWCGMAPTAWAVIANIAAQPHGPRDLFYVVIGALLLLRIVRAARSPVSIDESYPVREQSPLIPQPRTQATKPL